VTSLIVGVKVVCPCYLGTKRLEFKKIIVCVIGHK
jgi:hypothetical protein